MAGLVVLHVSDAPKDVPRALAAAELITSKEPMRVKVIVNGPAVHGLVAEKNDPEEMQPCEGVRIFACRRALWGQNLTLDELGPAVESVPSAVIALATAQHEGAAYIRI